MGQEQTFGILNVLEFSRYISLFLNSLYIYWSERRIRGRERVLMEVVQGGMCLLAGVLGRSHGGTSVLNHEVLGIHISFHSSQKKAGWDAFEWSRFIFDLPLCYLACDWIFLSCAIRVHGQNIIRRKLGAQRRHSRSPFLSLLPSRAVLVSLLGREKNRFMSLICK